MDADTPKPCARVLDDGFTILSDGGTNPVADVVFVHGLGGHPRRTWTTSARAALASAEPPARVSKKSHFSWLRRRANKPPKQSRNEGAESATPRPSSAGSDRSETPSSPDVFWPHDLLAIDLRNIRILTFGYTSDPRTSVKHNLYTLSTNLLSRLADQRLDHPTRPIIFICHSLGGILTKFALKISSNSSGASERLKTIRESTRAIIFFATPHAGSQLANIGEILIRISGLFAVTNTALLAALNAENDNGQLEELRLEFDKMMGNPHEGGIKVVNFRETMPMSSVAIGPTAHEVVPLASAGIASQWAENLTMAANHRDICKFHGFEDPKYQDLKAVLRRYVAELGQNPRIAAIDEHRLTLPLQTQSSATTSSVVNYKNAVTKEKIVNHFTTLSSMDINQHLYEVQSAHEQSFRWISDHSHFTTTLEPDKSTIFHITGKPGCGKSVLSKLVYELVRDHEEYNCCTLFFAFNERDNLRRDPVNMMASLVAQFVDKFGVTDPVSSQCGPEFNPGRWTERSVSTIGHLFYSMMASVPPGNKVIVVVDGMDECTDRGNLLSIISRVVSHRRQNTSPVSFVITSRPDSGIVFSLDTMVLDLNAENSLDVDLDAYVVSGVDRLVRNRPGLLHYREKIIAKLRSRADKMYLLVKLLLDLIREHPASSPAAIEALLSSLPKTLSAIYNKIWSLIPQQDEPRAKMILSWMLCAFRPLTVEEFSVGIARYEYDQAMKERYARCWRLPLKERLKAREHLQNPLEPGNSLEWYTPLDFPGDVARLLGPLIQISQPVGHEIRSPAVGLCHQSVKEHFLELPGFDIGNVHHQMAEVCARQLDKTITGDPDAIPVQNLDTMTVFGGEASPYPEFYGRHNEAIADANPLDTRKVYIRKMGTWIKLNLGHRSPYTVDVIRPPIGQYNPFWVVEILEADGWDTEWSIYILHEGFTWFKGVMKLMDELQSEATSEERKRYIQYELDSMLDGREKEMLQKGREMYSDKERFERLLDEIEG